MIVERDGTDPFPLEEVVCLRIRADRCLHDLSLDVAMSSLK